MWAILSGIEGNLAAYNAVLEDIKRQKMSIEDLYILGDLIAANPESEKVVQRIRFPDTNELQPQVCLGWWEEQCLILHGLSATAEPTELLEKYGPDTVKKLWESISLETAQWLRSLNFGFVELDCLLIHGSSISVSEELTLKTPPWQMLERLQRMEVNTLFCGRSGQVFEYHLQGGSIVSSVTTLEGQNRANTSTDLSKRVIGVGNVGGTPGFATYTLFNPNNNQIQFQTVHYS
ncbi:conserved hypothetical protein [Gloeothece citriformis PCC 7424]|uniref:Metallophosphatase n=1 Tax=Gloeothece citriformis (strain PCC 7424) TaxID=65393 RepID=B7KJE4_GLOC7|nr:metallo-dependent phosphatase [Gloeothece citriformis]ACK72228.1 conserved hypothetical protein [Gloeothece citriformis PCC 7424]